MKKEKNTKKKRSRLARQVKHLIVYVATQRTIVILLLLAQFTLIAFMFFGLERYSAKMQIVFQAMAAITAVYIINKNTKSEFKIGWLVPLVAFPIFTLAVHFILNNQYGTRVVRRLYAEKCEDTKIYLKQDEKLLEQLYDDDKDVYRYACYMKDYGGYPIHSNSQVTYFRSGEEKFEVLKDELRKAKKYIFIEMFIVDQGSLLDEIIEILAEKVKQGVEVRFLYDGMGSQHLLPFNYHKRLSEMGIKTLVFQPFVALLSTLQNNRDHRKIIVIDGHTGFTGGDNFADEYVNRIERFGYWKDTAVMIKGEAVWNLTMMFLQMWEVIDKGSKSADYENYRPYKHRIEKYEPDGYVLPYGDSPLDSEDVGELTYLHVLNTAKDYCYISTPYLVLNEELISTLCYTAKTGVDVRIIVPGIPDKWYVKVLGMSYFDELIEAGVRIYEYNGFNHAKMFVSDDCKAVVGTINLDYRSLYLHFEDACYLYKNSAIADIKSDFLYMFEHSCREVTLYECRTRPKYLRMAAGLLKILEPLL
jgi:cardiolipin synthase